MADGGARRKMVTREILLTGGRRWDSDLGGDRDERFSSVVCLDEREIWWSLQPADMGYGKCWFKPCAPLLVLRWLCSGDGWLGGRVIMEEGGNVAFPRLRIWGLLGLRSASLDLGLALIGRVVGGGREDREWGGVGFL